MRDEGNQIVGNDLFEFLDWLIVILAELSDWMIGLLINWLINSYLWRVDWLTN